MAWLAQKALNGEDLEPLYVASDCEPVRLDEVVDWVRSQVPCKAPPVEGARKAGGPVASAAVIENCFRVALNSGTPPTIGRGGTGR